MTKQLQTCGVILAGGKARRMNLQDKGLVCYHNKPLVSYAIAAMTGVVDSVIINANRNQTVYQQFNLPVISDATHSFDGPLAGVLAAMSYTKAEVLLVIPCDAPLFRAEHLQRLLMTLIEKQADAAVAFDGEREHPVFMAIKTHLRPQLQNYLSSGERKVMTWLQQIHYVRVDFSHEVAIFANINSLADLSDLQQKGKPC